LGREGVIWDLLKQVRERKKERERERERERVCWEEKEKFWTLLTGVRESERERERERESVKARESGKERECVCLGERPGRGRPWPSLKCLVFRKL
jgi:hypothetical protein